MSGPGELERILQRMQTEGPAEPSRVGAPPEQWQVQLTAANGSGYNEFRLLASKFGLPFGEASSVELDIDGTRVQLSLDINSGTVVGVTVKVWLREPGLAQHAPPSLRFRRETAADRRHKAAQVSVEVQLDDLDFDREVYIDADAMPHEVKRVLRDARHRESVRVLLTLVESVEVTDTISCTLKTSGDGITLARLLAVLQHGLTLAGLERPRGPVVPRRWAHAPIVLACAAIPTLFSLTLGDEGGPSVGHAGLLKSVIGAVVAFALGRAFFRQVMAGDSGSGRRAFWAALWLSLLTFGGVMWWARAAL